MKLHLGTFRNIRQMRLIKWESTAVRYTYRHVF